MPDATQFLTVRRFGAFEINPQSGELRKNGMRLRISGQPFQVLAVLVERAGEVVTREELQRSCGQPDTFVIETVPRRGYRFIAPLTDVAPPTDPSPKLTLAPAAVAPSRLQLLQFSDHQKGGVRSTVAFGRGVTVLAIPLPEWCYIKGAHRARAAGRQVTGGITFENPRAIRHRNILPMV
jgi:DNA-binding winged helix-turn-helix (wHTH) protein